MAIVVRAATAADHAQMLTVWGIAKADSRYCGNPADGVLSRADFAKWCALRIVNVAVDGSTVHGWVAFRKIADDTVEIDRYCLRFTGATWQQATAPIVKTSAQMLLALGITKCQSHVWPGANIDFAVQVSKGAVTYEGTDTTTGRPSSPLVTIDVAQVAK